MCIRRFSKNIGLFGKQNFTTKNNIVQNLNKQCRLKRIQLFQGEGLVYFMQRSLCQQLIY